jgi:hypothetical protein
VSDKLLELFPTSSELKSELRYGIRGPQRPVEKYSESKRMAFVLDAGGKPSTWSPPGELVEQPTQIEGVPQQNKLKGTGG